MNEIILDGCKMKSRNEAHKYIKDMFRFPDYYGENLDALWDLLSVYSNEISIYFINEENAKESLGEYADLMIGVFQEAASENDNIYFAII